jgi:hypothetical protein
MRDLRVLNDQIGDKEGIFMDYAEVLAWDTGRMGM